MVLPSISFLLTSLCLRAQNGEYIFPVASAKGSISQVVGNTQIEIEYERPLVRERKIFGDLVPWNKVWRTGAGHCTNIKLDKSVTIEGQRVPSGHYSLFTIPHLERWIAIINTDTALYGTLGYDQAKDVARFVVTPKLSERYFEALTIDVDILQNNAKLYISWANVQIDFNILTTTATDAIKFIEEQLFTGLSKTSDSYYEAAQYLLFQKEHLLDGLKLAEKAIKLNKDNGAARRVKVEIYEFLLLYKEALNEISQALEMEKNKRYENEEDRKSEIKYWQLFQKRIADKQEKL